MSTEHENDGYHDYLVTEALAAAGDGPALPTRGQTGTTVGVDPPAAASANQTGPCCLCGEDKLTPNETPADPPFYPAEGGRHCDDCEWWLLTGETVGG